jgi:predicted nuclease of restriction endonuclease-like (RecB) superfamily
MVLLEPELASFVARQKRIRIGSEWYRIDLLLYHRVLHTV